MKLKTAKEVQRWIVRDAPACRVTALIEDPETGHYSLSVLDTTMGEQFTIRNPTEWTTRMDELTYQ